MNETNYQSTTVLAHEQSKCDSGTNELSSMITNILKNMLPGIVEKEVAKALNPNGAAVHSDHVINEIIKTDDAFDVRSVSRNTLKVDDAFAVRSVSGNELVEPILLISNTDVDSLRHLPEMINILKSKGIHVVYAEEELNKLYKGFKSHDIYKLDSFINKEIELIQTMIDADCSFTVIHVIDNKYTIDSYERDRYEYDNWMRIVSLMDRAKKMDYVSSYNLFHFYHIPTITICGSYKFIDTMKEYAKNLIADGYIVNVPRNIEMNGRTDALTSADAIARHYTKIQNSDAILVIDVNGYIGDTTTHEILCAEADDKTVFYLEQPKSYKVDERYVGIW